MRSRTISHHKNILAASAQPHSNQATEDHQQTVADPQPRESQHTLGSNKHAEIVHCRAGEEYSEMPQNSVVRSVLAEQAMSPPARTASTDSAPNRSEHAPHVRFGSAAVLPDNQSSPDKPPRPKTPPATSSSTRSSDASRILASMQPPEQTSTAELFANTALNAASDFPSLSIMPSSRPSSPGVALLSFAGSQTDAILYDLHANYHYPRILLTFCTPAQLAKLREVTPNGNSTSGTASQSGSVSGSTDRNSSADQARHSYSPHIDLRRTLRFISDRTGASIEALSERMSLAAFVLEARRAIDVQIGTPTKVRRHAASGTSDVRNFDAARGLRSSTTDDLDLTDDAGPNVTFPSVTAAARHRTMQQRRASQLRPSFSVDDAMARRVKSRSRPSQQRVVPQPNIALGTGGRNARKGVGQSLQKTAPQNFATQQQSGPLCQQKTSAATKNSNVPATSKLGQGARDPSVSWDNAFFQPDANELIRRRSLDDTGVGSGAWNTVPRATSRPMESSNNNSAQVLNRAIQRVASSSMNQTQVSNANAGTCAVISTGSGAMRGVEGAVSGDASTNIGNGKTKQLENWGVVGRNGSANTSDVYGTARFSSNNANDNGNGNDDGDDDEELPPLPGLSRIGTNGLEGSSRDGRRSGSGGGTGSGGTRPKPSRKLPSPPPSPPPSPSCEPPPMLNPPMVGPGMVGPMPIYGGFGPSPMGMMRHPGAMGSMLGMMRHPNMVGSSIDSPAQQQQQQQQPPHFRGWRMSEEEVERLAREIETTGRSPNEYEQMELNAREERRQYIKNRERQLLQHRRDMVQAERRMQQMHQRHWRQQQAFGPQGQQRPHSPHAHHGMQEPAGNFLGPSQGIIPLQQMGMYPDEQDFHMGATRFAPTNAAKNFRSGMSPTGLFPGYYPGSSDLSDGNNNPGFPPFFPGYPLLEQ